MSSFSEIQNMQFDFARALDVLRSGRLVTRLGWNGRNQFLALQRPDQHSKMTLPYIYIKTVHGDFVPWVGSQTDLLSRDWMEFTPTPQP